LDWKATAAAAAAGWQVKKDRRRQLPAIPKHTGPKQNARPHFTQPTEQRNSFNVSVLAAATF